jgi:hypothetical protein
MCREPNCQHTKYDPNATKTLSTEDQSKLWSQIKAVRREMTAHVDMLTRTGTDQSKDRHLAKLENTTRNLWERFRKL